ncbi:multidrug resistance protein, MATE family [Litoreibacter ascidiaceicola]|uniref:Multidrug-efflux transporter n=1 Tax=Litoreibacter ascidiaceicola TaxID=1486859 RepID=A0A1M4UT42_9RHOB|nr:MATE family efflux transporter [Litoreibacter ascidiaceicola]SHE59849.1 multidrug resistance protein, MATE family [Litoreibacter ascidiaceicola]
MTFPQHMRAVLVLGLPLVGSHLAQFAVHMVDTIMLGWYDVTALAASVLATSFFFVVFIMGAGFSFAVMPMVAEAAASENGTRIRRVTRMGLWLSVLYALAFLPLMIWSDPLLRALGQDPELSTLSQDYLRIAGFGLFPALLVMVIKSYLAALERTGVVLWVTIMAVFLNVLVNYALIFGNLGMPELGLRGAAIASVISQVVTLAVLGVYVVRGSATREHVLFQRIWRPDPEAFREVFRLGWPIGLTNLAESGMFSASALIIGLIGTLPLAAHGIALQITAATFMIHVGLSQAATVRAGRAMGRRDWDGLALGARAVVILSMGAVVLATIAFLTVPELLMTGFLDPDSPDRTAILTIGASLLAVAALFQLVDAGQVMALGLLRGIQDTRWPMYAAALSYWGLGIPASYVLGVSLGYGGVGVWLGLVIGLMFAAGALWWRFARRYAELKTA